MSLIIRRRFLMSQGQGVLTVAWRVRHLGIGLGIIYIPRSPLT